MTTAISDWQRYAERLRAIEWDAVEKCNEAALYEAQDATMKLVLMKQLLKAFLQSPTRGIYDKNLGVAQKIGLTVGGVYLRIKLMGLTVGKFRDACTPKENNYAFDFDQSLDQLVQISVIPAMTENASKLLNMKNPPLTKKRRRAADRRRR